MRTKLYIYVFIVIYMYMQQVPSLIPVQEHVVRISQYPIVRQKTQLLTKANLSFKIIVYVNIHTTQSCSFFFSFPFFFFVLVCSMQINQRKKGRNEKTSLVLLFNRHDRHIPGGQSHQLCLIKLTSIILFLYTNQHSIQFRDKNVNLFIFSPSLLAQTIVITQLYRNIQNTITVQIH